MELILQKWDAILTQLESEFGISEASMVAWQIAELKLHRIENNIVYFIVPEKLKQLVHRYDDKFGTPLLVSIIEETNQILDGVKFITSDDESIKAAEEKKKAEIISKPPAPKNTDISQSSIRDDLNPKYTFDTYVVGENNRLAYSSCMAVAESPGEQYNPLFLYGGPGLGKTHLMNAIAHFIIENIPNKKILFVNTNDFVNEIVYTIQNTNKSNVTKFMENLRDKYDSLDVLLIDDIQFIIGKEHTQEEFFHIFNSLYESGKQIIISSDRPPRELKTLEERLVSRFNMGVTTDISSPSYETRRAILSKKNQLGRYHMDEDILDYIAKNISTNVRDLEGALNKLVAFSSLYTKKVTLEDAEHELRYLISPDHPIEITPDFIIKTVAEYFNLTADELISTRRSKNLTVPRHIAMYLCREHTQLSYKEIGEAFGGRDHSTCLSGIRKIENEYLNQINDTRTVIDILNKKITPGDRN
ncbi:MAG: chromosomal replication initiator protein DnaA [Lachnospiraceae bacterium]|nr:chromosomal replication initiator protein DnaA [Lachnospiraceae bacterium]